MPANLRRRRSAGDLPHAHKILRVQGFEPLFFRGLEWRAGSLGHRTLQFGHQARRRALLARGFDGPRDELMGGGKADALAAHQRIGQFGHRHQAARGAPAQALAVDFGGGEHGAEKPPGADAVAESRKDQGLEIVLVIVDVAEGRVVNGGEDGLCLPERFAGENPGVFERDRIPLLRHDAARLHVAGREPQKTVLLGAPQQQVLHQAAQVHHRRRERARRSGHVIDSGDGVVGVLDQTFEAEQFGGHRAVDREAGGGDRAGAERAAIDHREGRLQPLEIAPGEIRGRHQVVSHGGGLGRLRVGIGRHERVEMARGLIEEDGSRRVHRFDQRGQFLAQAHAIERQVDVVAAAGGMHLAGGLGAGDALDLVLQIKEEILEAAVVARLGDFRAVETAERAEACVRFRRRQQAHALEHQRVRHVQFDERFEKIAAGILEIHRQYGLGVDRSGKAIVGAARGKIVRHGSNAGHAAEPPRGVRRIGIRGLGGLYHRTARPNWRYRASSTVDW